MYDAFPASVPISYKLYFGLKSYVAEDGTCYILWLATLHVWQQVNPQNLTAGGFMMWLPMMCVCVCV